jgi:hypothetical protein
MGWQKISTHLVVGELTASPVPKADEDGDPNGLRVELENGILGGAYLLQNPRV